MRRIAQLLACIGIGLAIAWVAKLDVATFAHSGGYRLAAFALLAIGLYGATYGIDLHQARQDKKIIFSAVTLGVVAKALLIGGCLAFAFGDPLFIILGVTVAQIDPLSVAALMRDERMSTRARTVLAAWSSFDDPFTVVLAIYAAAVATNTFGLGHAAPSGTDPFLLYATDLGANLALAGIAWLAWRILRRGPAWLQYAALLALVVTAIATGWMLAIALIGLFARPATLARVIPVLTRWALYAAAVALGVLLISGVSIVAGIALGAAAYLAQAIVAWPLTRRMPTMDRWHLAAAQQNGITAIILALTLQIQFDGVVAVVAPAIVTANLLHTLANHVLDRRTAAKRSPSQGWPSEVEEPVEQSGAGDGQADGRPQPPAKSPG
ncbi:MAG TPA: cation:proton antiporter [Micromonosporaceae bacterium]